jgi:hypothetical protein
MRIGGFSYAQASGFPIYSSVRGGAKQSAKKNRANEKFRSVALLGAVGINWRSSGYAAHCT